VRSRFDGATYQCGSGGSWQAGVSGTSGPVGACL